jgi:hypothetical protein
MRYFKAQELAFKPLIAWYSGTFTEGDPLVLPEDEIPANVYGVCPLKIVGGELVARTAPEMTAFEEEYDLETALRTQERKIDDINTATFTWALSEYPMYESARLRYLAMKELNPVSMNVQAVDRVVLIVAADYPAFLAAYYTQLLTLTTP